MKNLKYEPALILYGINAVVAFLVAYGLPLSTTETAAVTTIATAVLGIVTAFLTRTTTPDGDSHLAGVIVAAFTTGAVALGAFGLHLSQPKIATSAVLLSVVLGVLLRMHVSPVPSPAPAPAAKSRKIVT